MTPGTLIGHLARQVRSRPGSLAVAYGTSGFTYEQLWEGVLRAAGLLLNEGVKPRDRVVLAAPREPAFLYAYFACHLLHAVAVPHEPDIVPAKLQRVVALLRPRIVLTGRDTPPEAVPCRSLPLAAVSASAAQPYRDALVEPNPEDTADVLLTSGTTGSPKGVMLSHGNILAAARNINQFIGNTAEDREALALPLSHSFGLGRVRCQALAGGALILTAGFQFPKQIFEAMRNWRATGFSFVPAAWAVLLRLSGERLAEFSSQLRYIEIGSAAMARGEKERLIRLFPRTRICMHYGLTEASRSAFIEFHQSKERLDSIGRATPNVEIQVVDDDGRTLEPGQVGKLRISGEHVMSGYWDASPGERTQRTPLYSGDLGYRDQHGYLYLCGREDDLINVGGRKVHPAEVEHALLGHPRIWDAVCVAMPDAVTGEAVRAFLVAKPGQGDPPSAEALADFLAARLEQYKVPLAFDWVASIPRNPSGKVERKALARLLGGTLDEVNHRIST